MNRKRKEIDMEWNPDNTFSISPSSSKTQKHLYMLNTQLGLRDLALTQEMLDLLCGRVRETCSYRI